MYILKWQNTSNRIYWIGFTADTAKDKTNDLAIGIMVKFLKIIIYERKY